MFFYFIYFVKTNKIPYIMNLPGSHLAYPEPGLQALLLGCSSLMDFLWGETTFLYFSEHQ